MDETLKYNIDSPIYVFSGGKGLPANSLIRSVLVQFPENKIPVKVILFWASKYEQDLIYTISGVLST